MEKGRVPLQKKRVGVQQQIREGGEEGGRFNNKKRGGFNNKKRGSTPNEGRINKNSGRKEWEGSREDKGRGFCEFSQLYTNTFLTTTTTNTITTTRPQPTRKGWRFCHHRGCDYTPVSPGKDTHGSRRPLQRMAVGGRTNHYTYDTTSDDSTTRTGLESFFLCETRTVHIVITKMLLNLGRRSTVMKLASATLRDPATLDQKDEQFEYFSVSVNFRVFGKMTWCRVFAFSQRWWC